MYTQVAKRWLAHQPQMEPVQREFLKKALAFYEQFAGVSSLDPSVRFDRARAYSRVAEIQYKLGDSGHAEIAYDQAIALLQVLVDDFTNDTEYQKMLADCLHDLGVFLGDTGRVPQEG